MIRPVTPLSDRAGAPDGAVAIRTAARTVTYGELRSDVRELAHRLGSEGIVSGSLVAARGASEYSAIILAHALWELRAAFVPLNARWTGAELEPALDRLGSFWMMSQRQGDPGAFQVDHVSRGPSCFEAEGWPNRARTSEGTQLILFTSGTTGRPKAAMISFRAIEASARAAQTQLGLSGKTRWLACLPLFHIGGLSIAYRSAFYGSELILHPGFEASAANAAIDRGECDIVSLVPTMLHRLLAERAGRRFPDTLKCILLGGAKAPARLLAEAQRLGAPVAPTYGLTETASQLCTLPPQEFLKLPDRELEAPPLPPLPGMVMKIVRRSGETYEPGFGEIAVRGPVLMSGYLGDPEATAAALGGGWLHTGDIGKLTPDGSVIVSDRRSDLIVTGGENVYPAEVEAVIESHPDISEAAVVGLPDGEWGQRVAAVIAANRPPAGLDRFCREHLAGYKVPRTWKVVAELPRTASGKISRKLARELFC